MSPVRVQRQRAKGWRTPQCTCGRGDPHPAIYVGRGSRWGNPYKPGRTYRQSRVTPAGHIEYRLHTVTDNTDAATQYADAYRTTGWGMYSGIDPCRETDIHQTLGGHDLMCWCPLDQPCHADTLIHLANQEAP